MCITRLLLSETILLGENQRPEALLFGAAAGRCHIQPKMILFGRLPA